MLGPGPAGMTAPGLLAATNHPVALRPCNTGTQCLSTPGTPLLTTMTNSNGTYVFSAPRVIAMAAGRCR